VLQRQINKRDGFWGGRIHEYTGKDDEFAKLGYFIPSYNLCPI